MVWPVRPVLTCRAVTLLGCRRHHLHRLPCEWCAWSDRFSGLDMQGPLHRRLCYGLLTGRLFSLCQGSRATLDNDIICCLSSSPTGCLPVKVSKWFNKRRLLRLLSLPGWVCWEDKRSHRDLRGWWRGKTNHPPLTVPLMKDP